MSHPDLLFHFTAKMHLPNILREGISRGEVPTMPLSKARKYNDVPQAVNLTRNQNAHSQNCWSVGVMDKTAIRLTIDATRLKVVTFKDVRKQYKIPHSYISQLAPAKEHFDWYFVFGIVHPSSIRVIDVKCNDHYRALDAEAVQSLIEQIEVEKRQFDIINIDGANAFTLKEGVSDSWLIDGAYRSEYLEQVAENRRAA